VAAAIRQLRGFSVRRQVPAYKQVLYYLQLVCHHYNKLTIIDKCDKLIKQGKKSTRLAQALTNLQRAAIRLRKVNSLLLEGIYYRYEIGLDNYKKFDGELKKAKRYITLLKK
jgi:hypothetical protein